jgi:hypothetical protein
MARRGHKRALDLSYEEYITLNGGEHCGICERRRKDGGRKLHRDHDHRAGKPRGLLCFQCNRALPYYADAEWLDRAAAYVRRTA